MYFLHVAFRTGLDPAGPWFDGYDAAARLNPRAATLVDVMHTDGGGKVPYYGLISPVGHMDFYPNRGYDQPGCKSSLMRMYTRCKNMFQMVVFVDTFRAKIDKQITP